MLLGIVKIILLLKETIRFFANKNLLSQWNFRLRIARKVNLSLTLFLLRLVNPFSSNIVFYSIYKRPTPVALQWLHWRIQFARTDRPVQEEEIVELRTFCKILPNPPDTDCFLCHTSHRRVNHARDLNTF